MPRVVKNFSSISLYNNEGEFNEEFKTVGSIVNARKCVASMFVSVLSRMFDIVNYSDIDVLFEEGIGCVLSFGRSDCSNELMSEIVSKISKSTGIPFEGYWSKGLSTNGFIQSHLKVDLNEIEKNAKMVVFCDRSYAKDLVRKHMFWGEYKNLPDVYKQCFKSMMIDIEGDAYVILEGGELYYGRRVIDVFDIFTHRNGSATLYITTKKGSMNFNSVNQRLVNCKCSVSEYYINRFKTKLSGIKSSGLINSVDNLTEYELNMAGLSILVTKDSLDSLDISDILRIMSSNTSSNYSNNISLYYFDVANIGDRLSFDSPYEMRKNLHSISFN